MSEQQVKEIIELQQKVLARLLQLGDADGVSAQRISRHLAEIAILGAFFGKSTLPLFLEMDAGNEAALAQLSVSMKCDPEEIADAITDLDADLGTLMEFLNRGWPGCRCQRTGR